MGVESGKAGTAHDMGKDESQGDTFGKALQKGTMACTTFDDSSRFDVRSVTTSIAHTLRMAERCITIDTLQALYTLHLALRWERQMLHRPLLLPFPLIHPIYCHSGPVGGNGFDSRMWLISR